MTANPSFELTEGAQQQFEMRGVDATPSASAIKSSEKPLPFLNRTTALVDSDPRTYGPASLHAIGYGIRPFNASVPPLLGSPAR